MESASIRFVLVKLNSKQAEKRQCGYTRTPTHSPFTHSFTQTIGMVHHDLRKGVVECHRLPVFHKPTITWECSWSPNVAMKGIIMEIILYQQPSQDAAAAGALRIGHFTGSPHHCRRAQDHLWLAVAAATADDGIKEHVGFRGFASRCFQLMSYKG